jgi:hypothetical protein
MIFVFALTQPPDSAKAFGAAAVDCSMSSSIER